jgi:glucokinase
MILGIEIGGTKLQLVIGDGSARILDRRRLTVNPTLRAKGIRDQIRSALPELVGDRKLSAIGVGFGGPVDWRTGKIARSHQIEGWSGFDLAGWLRELTGASVAVDNDANVAALGEAICGAGVDFDPVFYATLGSGVGGGLVLGGKIYHGATPGESELGHVRLDRQGTTLESRCSGWAVDTRIRELKARDPNCLLARLSAGSNGGEAQYLEAALKQNDTDAQTILNETAADLAFGLSHVVHLFHPAVIVLGGGLAKVGEPLRVAVEAALSPLLMAVFRPEFFRPLPPPPPSPQVHFVRGEAGRGERATRCTPVRLSTLREDAVPTGALLLAAVVHAG